MKKKIKDLTFNDIYNICKKYHYTSCKETEKSSCDKCPISSSLCGNDDVDDVLYNILERACHNEPSYILEKEIEVEENAN